MSLFLSFIMNITMDDIFVLKKEIYDQKLKKEAKIEKI